jgi:hypothetical protein
VANWQPIISVATAAKAMLDFAVGDKHRSPVCDLIGLQVYFKRKQEVRGCATTC